VVSEVLVSDSLYNTLLCSLLAHDIKGR